MDTRHGFGRRAIRWLPYGTLAGSTVLMLLTDFSQVLPIPVGLAVVGAVALWLFWFITLHPQWIDRPAVMRVFLIGLYCFFPVLILASPLFALFIWSGYMFVVTALQGRRALAGAALVAVFSAIGQIGGFVVIAEPGVLPGFLVLLAFNVVIGVAMTRMAMSNDAESERRRQMVIELGEANTKLAAAMRENAGLHAQLLAQAREAGVLDERQRLAGEIHDVLAQGLTGIVTQLEAADAATDRPADHDRHLAQARRLARDGLTEVRRSVQALRPQQLAAAALPDALTGVVDDWAALNDVPAELITTGTVRPLTPEVETTLLRAAQEALANVARHAGASRVALTLSYMEDVVSLDVRDDGAGFDPAAPREASEAGGHGLTAMRERLRRIAGTLEVESEPGAGTAISACVRAAA
ncbi:sensor histidine kinase [Actinoplanes sp. NPDC051470]|uniref:sensor histidine kinase n=1 Tax=Actinoplanes sp. NPDC051470 TaxID=3157224 RepID=UPI003442BFC8